MALHLARSLLDAFTVSAVASVLGISDWASRPGRTIRNLRFGVWGAVVPETTRLLIPSSTAILLRFQIIYSAFFVNLLEIRASHTRKLRLKTCTVTSQFRVWYPTSPSWSPS